MLRIFGLKGEKITRRWGKFPIEKLHDTWISEIRNKNIISSGKPERRLLGSSNCRREDNIKLDLKQIECGLNSTVTFLGLMVGSCEHGNKPSCTIKGRVFF